MNKLIRNFFKGIIPLYYRYSDLKGMRIPTSYIVFLYQSIFSKIYWYHPSSMYIGMEKRVYVGKNSNIGRTLNFFQAKGGIYIGNYVGFATRVSLLTSNHDLYNQNISHSAPIEIGDYCWLGMNTTILAGVKLGCRTIVANGAVVTKSFPEGFCVIGGVPAKIIKHLDPQKFNPQDYEKKTDYYGFIPASKVEKNLEKFLKRYLDNSIFKISNNKIVLK